MAFQNVIYERRDSIAYVTLNRPDKLNAINGPLLADFQDAMDVAEVDPDVRVVIITGAGRAFSAGFDITPDPGAPHPHKGSPDGWRTHLQGLIDGFMKVWNLPKPVIAAVNGYALGGACEMVQVCDIKIASDRAVMGEPEIRAGFGPPLLVTPYSVNLANAKELLLTGNTVDAHEAARIGLVNRVVPHDQLMDECEARGPQDVPHVAAGYENDQGRGEPGPGEYGVPERNLTEPGVDDYFRHQHQPGTGGVQRRRRREGVACGPRLEGRPLQGNWTKPKPSELHSPLFLKERGLLERPS